MFRHTHATELLRAGWDAAYVQRRSGMPRSNDSKYLLPSLD